MLGTRARWQSSRWLSFRGTTPRPMRTLVVAWLLATYYAAALTPAKPRQRTPHRGATRLAATPTSVRVLDHHLGGMMLGLDRVEGFLEAIAALEPKKIKSDKFQYPKSLSDPDWDGSISINTYTDYSTLYGPFTVHSYREEWDSGTDIYATDAETGKDLMTYIVQCMRASGRYRGELFDTDDGEREDSERLREMDEVEADYAGCLVRVECRVDGLEASAPTQAWHVLSRKYCEGPRRRYVRHRLLQVC